MPKFSHTIALPKQNLAGSAAVVTVWRASYVSLSCTFPFKIAALVDIKRARAVHCVYLVRPLQGEQGFAESAVSSPKTTPETSHSMSDPENMLGLVEPLQKIVTNRFLSAYRAKDLLFSDTALAYLRNKDGVSVSSQMGQNGEGRTAHLFQVSIAVLPCTGSKAPK